MNSERAQLVAHRLGELDKEGILRSGEYKRDFEHSWIVESSRRDASRPPAAGAKVRRMEPGAETDRAAEVGRQREVIEEQGRRIADLEAMAVEREQLRRRLADAEQELATLPELRRAVQELEAVRSSAAWRLASALRVPSQRARGMWLPALRKRAKHVLGRVMSL